MLYDNPAVTRLVEGLLQWLMLEALFSGGWGFALLQWYYAYSFESRRMRRTEEAIQKDERRGSALPDWENQQCVGRRRRP